MSKVLEIIVDLLTLLGCACSIYGVWQIYSPAGWIVCGLELVLLAFLLARGDSG